MATPAWTWRYPGSLILLRVIGLSDAARWLGVRKDLERAGGRSEGLRPTEVRCACGAVLGLAACASPSPGSTP